MTFSERMQELFEQGAAATKDFAIKAGAKAQDLGERGVLMVEVRQLEYQAQKLINRLGAEAYSIFAEKGESSISRDSAPIKSLLSEIAAIRETIEAKEAELALRKGK